jgi:hypothetical protein
MRRILLSLVVAGTLSAGGAAFAATADQEAAFVNSYKTAFEAQDAATLESFLFTDGAIPAALEFYKMAMTADFGQKITTIELQALDADDIQKVGMEMPGPDGAMARLAPKPCKKLVITIETKDDSGSMKSTNTIFIAEKDGKLGRTFAGAGQLTEKGAVR